MGGRGSQEPNVRVNYHSRYNFKLTFETLLPGFINKVTYEFEPIVIKKNLLYSILKIDKKVQEEPKLAIDDIN
jgi:hypothetical protein